MAVEREASEKDEGSDTKPGVEPSWAGITSSDTVGSTIIMTRLSTSLMDHINARNMKNGVFKGDIFVCT